MRSLVVDWAYTVGAELADVVSGVSKCGQRLGGREGRRELGKRGAGGDYGPMVMGWWCRIDSCGSGSVFDGGRK